MSLTGQTLTLIFLHDRGFLTRDTPLTLAQLDLPDPDKSFKSPAYWVIRVLRHSEPERKLYVEVMSYHIGEAAFAPEQVALAGQLAGIETVKFKSIDTYGLLKTMTGTTPMAIRPTLANPVAPKPAQLSSGQGQHVSPLTTIRETFSVSFKNLRFRLGGVSFDRKFKAHPASIEVTIPNYDIREEFDAIKNYFANVLATKKITVTAGIVLENGEVTSVEAKSPEIDKINKELIDNVKFEFVRATKKKVGVEIDKTLFTMEEYLAAYGEEKFQSNTFYKNDRELFEDLLAISNAKHYKQLRYLSSLHAHHIMKLRFVHKPFSFIFLIEGERHYHIIWETLDTEEATYIWHVTKEIGALRMALRKIEDIINVVKVQGKTAYIHSTDDPFRRIYHDYSNLVDGFVRWKGELENILT